MFKKPTLILAATLIATLSTQSSASADNNRSQIIDHRTPVNEIVRDHRTPPKATHRTGGRKTVIDHRVPATTSKRSQKTRRNEVVIIKRIPCNVGYSKLLRAGYRISFTPVCTGNKYGYTATKGGEVYSVSMYAYSGVMEFRRLGIIPPH